MPSGYSSALPSDVLLDQGLLYIGTTVWGASTGALKWEPGTTYRNVGFAGKRTEIAGLDRIIRRAPKITGQFLEFGTVEIPRLEDAVVGAISGGITTYTPRSALGLLPSGIYLANVSLVFARAGGGYVVIRFALARITYTSLAGAVDAEGTYDLVVEARQLANAPSTDDPPYVIELYAAGSTPPGVGLAGISANITFSTGTTPTIAVGTPVTETVTVTDAYGTPVVGATVTVASNDTSIGTVSPASAVTDASGHATFTLTRLTSGTLSFAFQAGNASGTVSGGGGGTPVLTTITWKEGNTGSVPASGTLVRTAVAKDQNGAVMAGVVIAATLASTTHVTRAPASGTSDVNGEVAFTLTWVAAGGPDNLTATSGAVSSAACAITAAAGASYFFRHTFTGAAADNPAADTGEAMVASAAGVTFQRDGSGQLRAHATGGNSGFLRGWWLVTGGFNGRKVGFKSGPEDFGGARAAQVAFGFRLADKDNLVELLPGNCRIRKWSAGGTTPYQWTDSPTGSGGTPQADHAMTDTDLFEIVFNAGGTLATGYLNGTLWGYLDLTGFPAGTGIAASSSDAYFPGNAGYDEMYVAAP